MATKKKETVPVAEGTENKEGFLQQFEAAEKEASEKAAQQDEAEKARQEQMQAVKTEITQVLLNTGRDGVADLVDVMDEMGFFEAPASSGGGRHSAEAGGLATHSLNVLHTAEKMSVALIGGRNIDQEFRQSLALVCLLHDLGKMGDFGKKLYVPNILKSGKQSDAKPWEKNKELTNIPHSIKSVIIAERWVDLTEEEEYAIMYHDGLYDRETGGMTVIQGHETRLLMILHWADMWSSRIIEGSNGDE